MFGTDGYNANLNHVVKCEPGEAFCQRTKANFFAGAGGYLGSTAILSMKIGPGHFFALTDGLYLYVIPHYCMLNINWT
jgi:hypothetical protein